MKDQSMTTRHTPDHDAINDHEDALLCEEANTRSRDLLAENERLRAELSRLLGALDDNADSALLNLIHDEYHLARAALGGGS